MWPEMTLDEAIRHCGEVSGRCSSGECSREHLQLKSWLEELRTRREIEDRDEIDEESDLIQEMGYLGESDYADWLDRESDRHY